MQSLFRLKRHRTLVAGLFALAPSTLVDLAKHSSASHIFDAFLSSKAIATGEKKQLVGLFEVSVSVVNCLRNSLRSCTSHDNFLLLLLLKGSWCMLASDKFGSRLLDSCWKYALDFDEKAKVAGELSRSAADLKRAPIGRLIHKKYELDLFAVDAKRWKKAISSQENKVKLLTALIE